MTAGATMADPDRSGATAPSAAIAATAARAPAQVRAPLLPRAPPTACAPTPALARATTTATTAARAPSTPLAQSEPIAWTVAPELPPMLHQLHHLHLFPPLCHPGPPPSLPHRARPTCARTPAFLLHHSIQDLLWRCTTPATASVRTAARALSFLFALSAPIAPTAALVWFQSPRRRRLR